MATSSTPIHACERLSQCPPRLNMGDDQYRLHPPSFGDTFSSVCWWNRKSFSDSIKTVPGHVSFDPCTVMVTEYFRETPWPEGSDQFLNTSLVLFRDWGCYYWTIQSCSTIVYECKNKEKKGRDFLIRFFFHNNIWYCVSSGCCVWVFLTLHFLTRLFIRNWSCLVPEPDGVWWSYDAPAGLQANLKADWAGGARWANLWERSLKN